MRCFTINMEGSRATLTAYLQDVSTEMPMMSGRPAIMICPGGSYEMCSDREAEPIALAYLAEGYNAFVLRYTVGREVEEVFQKAFADAENALELLRANAKEWNINPKKIAVIGFSAGGHLASCLGSMGKIRPNVILLGYPAIYFEERDEKGRPDSAAYVDRYTPPTFMFSTLEDEAVAPMLHPIRFAVALQKAHVPYEMHIFERGGHGYSLAKTHTAGGKEGLVDANFAQWFPMSINWLKLHMGDFEVKPDANYVKTRSKSMKMALEYLVEDDKKRTVLYEVAPNIKDLIINNSHALDYNLVTLARILPHMLPIEVQKRLDGEFLKLEKQGGLRR